MEIKYRLIDTFPDEHQVLVRFFTDTLPEDQLVSAWKADGVTPDRYRTDYLITLPVPAPAGADFDAFILRHCPVYWFDLKEKIANPAVDTSLQDIDANKGTVSILTATIPVPYVPTARDMAKQERAAAVSEIKVTTAAGNTFDGDETSQDRMTRAIVALQATGALTVTWVLADNTVIQASVDELVEALALSGAAQAAVWVI
jgi:hypothetical protein